jgi:hypothetical protein
MIIGEEEYEYDKKWRIVGEKKVVKDFLLEKKDQKQE